MNLGSTLEEEKHVWYYKSGQELMVGELINLRGILTTDSSVLRPQQISFFMRGTVSG